MIQIDPKIPVVLTFNNIVINCLNITAYDNINSPLSISAYYLDSTNNFYHQSRWYNV
jgi:hypothetical protein